jgi:hypothetical protein
MRQVKLLKVKCNTRRNKYRTVCSPYKPSPLAASNALPQPMNYVAGAQAQARPPICPDEDIRDNIRTR